MNLKAMAAAEMLESGWRIAYLREVDRVRWIPPGSTWGDWTSGSLDEPPFDALKLAFERGDIRHAYQSVSEI